MRQNQNRTPKARFAPHWTADEEAILLRLWSDHSIGEIIPLLPNFSASAIKAKANHLGLSKDFSARRARGFRLKVSGRPKGSKDKHPRKQNRAVIAFEIDGVREFANAKEAAEHYGLKVQRVYDLISTAETTYSGIGFNYML